MNVFQFGNLIWLSIHFNRSETAIRLKSSEKEFTNFSTKIGISNEVVATAYEKNFWVEPDVARYNNYYEKN